MKKKLLAFVVFLSLGSSVASPQEGCVAGIPCFPTGISVPGNDYGMPGRGGGTGGKHPPGRGGGPPRGSRPSVTTTPTTSPSTVIVEDPTDPTDPEDPEDPGKLCTKEDQAFIDQLAAKMWAVYENPPPGVVSLMILFGGLGGAPAGALLERFTYWNPGRLLEALGRPNSAPNPYVGNSGLRGLRDPAYVGDSGRIGLPASTPNNQTLPYTGFQGNCFGCRTPTYGQGSGAGMRDLGGSPSQGAALSSPHNNPAPVLAPTRVLNPSETMQRLNVNQSCKIPWGST